MVVIKWYLQLHFKKICLKKCTSQTLVFWCCSKSQEFQESTSFLFWTRVTFAFALIAVVEAPRKSKVRFSKSESENTYFDKNYAPQQIKSQILKKGNGNTYLDKNYSPGADLIVLQITSRNRCRWRQVRRHMSTWKAFLNKRSTWNIFLKKIWHTRHPKTSFQQKRHP